MSYAAEKLTTKRTGELTFASLAGRKLLMTFTRAAPGNSGSKIRKERMNSANKCAEDFCYMTKQKNRAVVQEMEELVRGEDSLGTLWLFEMRGREYINNSVNKNKS